MRPDEQIFEVQNGNLAGKMCKCSKCGKIRRCTPLHDFYGKIGEKLICEKCLFKAHFGSESPEQIVVVLGVLACSIPSA